MSRHEKVIVTQNSVKGKKVGSRHEIVDINTWRLEKFIASRIKVASNINGVAIKKFVATHNSAKEGKARS